MITDNEIGSTNRVNANTNVMLLQIVFMELPLPHLINAKYLRLKICYGDYLFGLDL